VLKGHRTTSIIYTKFICLKIEFAPITEKYGVCDILDQKNNNYGE